MEHRELTPAVEEGEPHHVGCAHARYDLLDVMRPRSFLGGFDGRGGRVSDEDLGKEDLAEGGAPVGGRLREDGAELCRSARVHLRVVVGKCDGT